MKPIQVRLNPTRARDKDIASGLLRIESPRERAEFIRQAVYSALYPKYKPGITNEDLAMRIDNLKKAIERIVSKQWQVSYEATFNQAEEVDVIPAEDSVDLAPKFTDALKKAARPGMRYNGDR